MLGQKIGKLSSCVVSIYWATNFLRNYSVMALVDCPEKEKKTENWWKEVKKNIYVWVTKKKNKFKSNKNCRSIWTHFFKIFGED